MKRGKKETEAQFHVRLIDTLATRARALGINGLPLHQPADYALEHEDLIICYAAAAAALSREFKRLVRERNGLRKKVRYYAP
jgi:hypothetical protein